MHKFTIIITAVLFLQAAVFSLELHSDFSHIYSDKEGSSKAFSFSIKDSLPDEQNKFIFSYDLNFNKGESSHEQIEGKGNNINFSSSVKTSNLAFTGYFGLFNTSEIKINFDKELSNDGAELLYYGFDALFNIQGFSINPFFYYFNCDFKQGDMCYFMGYPLIPCGFVTGADINYEKNHLLLIYAPFNIEVKSNDNKDLFTSDSFCTGILYSRQFDFAVNNFEFNLNPFAAWYYAGGSFDGVLNRENQPYLYFVFDYYKIASDFDIHSIITGTNANLRRGHFKFNFDTALLLILQENLVINNSWKKLQGLAPWQEKLVWDSLEMEQEGSRKLYYNELDKTGLFIMNLALNYNFFNEHGHVNIAKKIIIPFSLNQDSKSKTSFTPNNMDSETIKNILLSGITLGLSLKF